MTSPLVSIRGLEKRFDLSGGLLEQITFEKGRFRRRQEAVHAINGVDLDVQRGEALCVVGESGCGKSTVARTVMGLISPSAGEIHYDGQRIDNLEGKAALPYRRRMQMIFQNPYASLNPRMTIQQTLEEPIRFHFPTWSAAEVRDKVHEVMQSVGIDPDWGSRFGHEFSGGQRQRIAIARALAVDPEFIVADEPISALDVSIQAQVLNLLMDAQESRSLTYLFITHDLAVVEHFGTRVAVMYLGRVCELADTRTLFATPRHPYTQALLSAIPKLEDDRPNHIRLQGEVPTPVNLPSGCVFHGRCPYANERCRREVPKLIATDGGTRVACHAVEEGRL
ncbi:oligopeptide/dipeptide ABC transporter ATP-binding protein [Marinobacter lutaoensis]|jgi:peptide/nickel transport system ATP-binding protein|uniref:ABC-type dipeptide transporter n=1 Tax=Marinobacter lutaoensis TaxID=135739 RepID=A0A1V2DVX6_9GAMM|nr:oligopeptide/dipeptide ABC transporter ATP-binding protein [Marinobacter lutaoensis]MBI43393.1 ABC transporter ATP-binding protein [Oceanospirillales bacterium]MBI44341.1 ABC transporter ATP-binding protein [Oceanospirillales bacterium]NVD36632.1 ATP-binding cassette domain-containing protein [Marinobacter lutaoensis]ONF44812.1 ABC transporter ATP-binding protein [Marinobacter lutaoensis]|tara:strand:- start:1365 stop:2375 length:1011 start_codon:yes stop_codon:yes gene_type:complete